MGTIRYVDGVKEPDALRIQLDNLFRALFIFILFRAKDTISSLMSRLLMSETNGICSEEYENEQSPEKIIEKQHAYQILHSIDISRLSLYEIARQPLAELFLLSSVWPTSHA